MKKVFNNILFNFFLLVVFIICNSYIINFVVLDFKKSFVEFNEFVKCFRNVFYVLSGRKSRFVNFLESRIVKKVRMLLNFIIKSWSAWFEFAIYYVEYFFVFSDFIKEVGYGGSIASNIFFSFEIMYFN